MLDPERNRFTDSVINSMPSDSGYRYTGWAVLCLEWYSPTQVDPLRPGSFLSDLAVLGRGLVKTAARRTFWL